MSKSKRKLIVESGQGWFDAARDDSYSMGEKLLNMENALNHTENALYAVQLQLADRDTRIAELEAMVKVNNELDELICPECGSDEVYYERCGPQKYVCQDCENEGEENDFTRIVLLRKNTEQSKRIAELEAGIKLTLKPFAVFGEKYKNFIPGPNKEDYVTIKLERRTLVIAYEALAKLGGDCSVK